MNAVAQVRALSLRWSDAKAMIAKDLDIILPRIAQQESLSERSLKSVVLLHLPQFTLEELSNRLFLHNEVLHVAQRVRNLQQGFEGWLDHQNMPKLRKNDFRAKAVSDCIAQDLHTRFHYLHSPHKGESIGIYYQTDAIPAAVVTLSAMDVIVLQKYSLSKPANARLLSRMFAFEWAPRNSISFLLSRAAAWTKHQYPNVDTFLTFVNPNVEFSGSSYRASNWKLVGTYPVHYRYFERVYISAREFHEISKSNSTIPPISYSRYELEPLEIWAYRL